MTTTSPAAAKPAAISDDEFGLGLFDDPVAKPVAPAQAPAPRAAAPVVSTPKPAPQADEDDGFGAGLL